MRIEIPIRWKIQGVNMGCFPACLAMLLSKHENSYETWEVMEKLLMPYRMEISLDNDELFAGSSVENDTLTKQALAYHFGFELYSEQTDDRSKFLIDASKLLHRGKAFITSVTATGGGHAIIVYGMYEETFLIHDPDNGIRYKRPVSITNYPMAPNKTLAKGDLVSRLQQGPSGMFTLGYLERAKTTIAQPPYPSQLLDDSDLFWEGRNPNIVIGVSALKLISDSARKLEEDLMRTSDINIFREIYYGWGASYLKPLKRNLYGAIAASGIVHFEDIERRRINSRILKSLERLHKAFMQGLKQVDGMKTMEDKPMEWIIHGIDELVVLFSTLAAIIRRNEKH